MKNLQVLIVLIVFFWGCTHSDKINSQTNLSVLYKNSIKLEEPKTIVKARLKKILVNEPLSYLSDIEFVDGYILVISPASDRMLKVIDPDTGKIVKSFARKGQGPDEFIGLASIVKDPLNSTYFWLYDGSTFMLKKYNFNDVLKGNFNPQKIIYNLSFFFHLTLLPDYSVAGVGYFSDARIKIKKNNGQIINIGNVPVNSDSFKQQHSQGFDGNIIYLPESREILLATMWGGLIEKYNFVSGDYKVFMLPDSFYPQYRIIQAEDGAHWTFNKNSRRGIFGIKFLDLTKKVFLLYSGEKVFFGKNQSRSRSKFIYVFNPESNILEKKIVLDKGLDFFSIGIKNGKVTIYGTAGDNIYRVLLDEKNNKN